MRTRAFIDRVSKPLTSETDLIWNDKQYLKNKRQFGHNQIAGWNGSWGFDRADQDKTQKYYTRNFRDQIRPVETVPSKRRNRTAHGGRRNKLREIIEQTANRPDNCKKTYQKPFVPARFKYTKHATDLYKTLFANTETLQLVDNEHKLYNTRQQKRTPSDKDSTLTDGRTDFTYRSKSTSAHPRSMTTIGDSKSWCTSKADIEMEFLAKEVSLERNKRKKLQERASNLARLLAEKAQLEDIEVRKTKAKRSENEIRFAARTMWQ
jgi:hypothetical protein